MTLSSGTIPEFWVIAFCIAVGTAVFAVLGVLLFLLDKRPTAQERANLYQFHERMTHLADPPTIEDRRAA